MSSIIKLQGPGQRTPPRAARPRSPRRTGHFLERRAGRGSWPATPRSEVGARSNGADASAARRRDVWSPTRANEQIFATSRRRCVSLSLPRPSCAGATRDYVGVVPARSRKSLAKLAEHAAKESKQAGLGRIAGERGRRRRASEHRARCAAPPIAPRPPQLTRHRRRRAAPTPAGPSRTAAKARKG